MKKNLIYIKNLCVTYGKIIAVDSFALNVGIETVVLFGPSGCGKTTILKSILGIHEAGKNETGILNFNIKDLNATNGDIGMLFQGPIIPTWLKVIDLCSMGSSIRKYDKISRKRKVESILTTLEIDDLINKYPYELSGGEKQRVALAATLLNDPKVLLLDEPTTFIDGKTRQKIWNYIETNIRTLNIPIIVVSHDSIESLIVADRIVVMGEKSQIVEIIEVPFKHPRSMEIFKNEEFMTLKSKLDQY